MATDPQVRATQEMTAEFKKLNRTLEALNANFVTFVKMLETEANKSGELQTTTPTRPNGGYFNAAQQQ